MEKYRCDVQSQGRLPRTLAGQPCGGKRSTVSLILAHQETETKERRPLPLPTVKVVTLHAGCLATSICSQSINQLVTPVVCPAPPTLLILASPCTTKGGLCVGSLKLLIMGTLPVQFTSSRRELLRSRRTEDAVGAALAARLRQ